MATTRFEKSPPRIPSRSRRSTRSRRSREEVASRIREAARELFAERGYAAATTKEIAKRAEASEVLLFRYFGDKARLFDTVISEPFVRLMQQFTALHPHNKKNTREEYSREFVAAVYRLFEDNRDLLSALVAAPGQRVGGPPTGLHGLDGYFKRAVANLEEQYRHEGGRLDVDPKIAVRVGFAMIASVVLLRDWLFTDDIPSEVVMTRVLERMMFKALTPVPKRNPASGRR